MNTLSWILGGVVVFIIFWLVATYNGLVRLRNQTREAWSDIDVQLKRRYDLIPNLIETVKGYVKHEKEVLEKVTEARAQAMQAGSLEDKARAENALSQTLKTLFAVAESYPQLRASENFAKLQDELSDTENKIQSARRFYNGNVRDFNTKTEVFPNNLVAGMLKFERFEFFEIEEVAERKNVEVRF